MTGEPFGHFAPTPEQARMIEGVRRNPILRRGKFRMRQALKIAALRNGPIDLERGGVKFRLFFDVNAIDWGIALMPGYEGKELAFLSDGLKEGATFIDIGANIGLYGLTLAQKVGPTGKVVAIEPDPVALSRVTENARLNAFPQYALVPLAAGAQDGELSFNSRTNPAHSHLSPDGNIKVKVRTLVSILADQAVTTIDALKIDVEGAEDGVLRPFFGTAPKEHWPRRVVIEDLSRRKSTGRTSGDIIALMHQIGYRPVGHNGENVFLVLD